MKLYPKVKIKQKGEKREETKVDISETLRD